MTRHCVYSKYVSFKHHSEPFFSDIIMMGIIIDITIISMTEIQYLCTYLFLPVSLLPGKLHGQNPLHADGDGERETKVAAI